MLREYNYRNIYTNIFFFRWAFKYGFNSLIGVAGLTGLYIGKYYRRKLKLQEHGYITTLFSTIISATFGAGYLHMEVYIYGKLILFIFKYLNLIFLRRGKFKSAEKCIFSGIFLFLFCNTEKVNLFYQFSHNI